MKRILGLIVGSFAVAVIFGAGSAWAAKPDCGENTGKAATGKPIPIGAVTSKTGPIGGFGEVDQTVEAFFKCVNANGGIHGRPLAFRDEDDQSSLNVAAQAAKKLVEDEGVYAMIGSTSAIECIANADYYIKHNIVEIGEGIPPQCYQSKNIAEVNAGPRQSGIGGVDYARRKLGIKSVVCSTFKVPGADYSCKGIEEWGKLNGVKVISIYSDPSSLDATSLVLQLVGTGADAVMQYGTDQIGAQWIEAAEQQDAAAKMKWTFPTSFYTVRLPGAIDSKYWNDRIWVNAELAPLDSKGVDNQNWIAVMDAYGGNTLRDSFSQAGYIAARVAVQAMLAIPDPDKINRDTVTAAIQNVKPYPTDILCAPWYWGGAQAAEHNANHVTRTVTIHDGHWKTLEGCHNDPDPGLTSIEALEKKLDIKTADTAK